MVYYCLSTGARNIYKTKILHFVPSIILDIFGAISIIVLFFSVNEKIACLTFVKQNLDNEKPFLCVKCSFYEAQSSGRMVFSFSLDGFFISSFNNSPESAERRSSGCHATELSRLTR